MERDGVMVMVLLAVAAAAAVVFGRGGAKGKLHLEEGGEQKKGLWMGFEAQKTPKTKQIRGVKVMRISDNSRAKLELMSRWRPQSRLMCEYVQPLNHPRLDSV